MKRIREEEEERIIRLFSLLGSHAILVLPYWYQTVWQYCNGDLPNGDVECSGYEKIVIFEQYSTLSRKLYKIDP